MSRTHPFWLPSFLFAPRVLYHVTYRAQTSSLLALLGTTVYVYDVYACPVVERETARQADPLASDSCSATCEY